MGSNSGGGGRAGRAVGGAAPAPAFTGGLFGPASALGRSLQRRLPGAGVELTRDSAIVSVPRDVPYTGNAVAGMVSSSVSRQLGPGYALTSRGVQGSNYRYVYERNAFRGTGRVERAVRGI